MVLLFVVSVFSFFVGIGCLGGGVGGVGGDGGRRLWLCWWRRCGCVDGVGVVV